MNLNCTSVVSEFRTRLVEGEAEQLLLERMLSRFKERGWVKARGRQRTDSTHILAAVRTLNRLELVGETLRAALNTLAALEPEWLGELAPAEWFERYGRAVDEYRLPKGVAARKEYAEVIGTDGMRLLAAVDGEDAPAQLRELPAVELLQRTWEDQYHIGEREARWREAGELPPAGARSGSPYDPDARFGNKRSTTWTGYKIHLTETCDTDEPHLITRVETTQAHLSDVAQTKQIHEDLARRGLLPGEHIADAGFVDGELLVKSRTEYGVGLLGPVRPNVGWQARIEGGYDITRFEVDWEGKKVICPEGQTSRSWSPKVDKWGNQAIQVKFSRTACGNSVGSAGSPYTILSVDEDTARIVEDLGAGELTYGPRDIICFSPILLTVVSAICTLCPGFSHLGETKPLSRVGEGTALTGTGGQGGAREDYSTILEKRQYLIPEHIRSLYQPAL